MNDFRFLPQEIAEAKDPVVVAGFYDQSRTNAGQFRKRLAFHDHRLRQNRSALERFEIWVLKRLADVDEADSAIERGPVKRLDPQVGGNRPRLEQTPHDPRARPRDNTLSNLPRP